MLALALAAVPAVTRADQYHQSGKGYFTIGWTGIDLGSLNDALQAEGYPRFSQDFLSVGGAGHGTLGRFVIGGQGQGFFIDHQDATIGGLPYRSTLRGGSGFFDLGVVAWSRGGFALTPLVGLGGGGMQLEIVEHSVPAFDAVLRDPGRSAHLTTWSFLIDVGASADFMVLTSQTGSRRGGPVFGIRAGYVFTPYTGGWQQEHTDVHGGPKLGLTGAYVRVLLGGGGAQRGHSYD